MGREMGPPEDGDESQPPTCIKDLPIWKRVPRRGWCVAAGTTTCFVLVSAFAAAHHLGYSHSLPLLCFIAVNTLHNFRKASTVVSQDIPPSGGEMCTKCARGKPPGTHHCSRCGRCVVGLDHHCEFLNNCVGEDNMRYYLRYVFWVASCAPYTALLTAQAFPTPSIPTYPSAATLLSSVTDNLSLPVVRAVAAALLAFVPALVAASWTVEGVRGAVGVGGTASLLLLAVGMAVTVPTGCEWWCTAVVALLLGWATSSLANAAGLTALFLAVVAVLHAVVFATPHGVATLAAVVACVLTTWLLVHHLTLLYHGKTQFAYLLNLPPDPSRAGLRPLVARWGSRGASLTRIVCGVVVPGVD